MKLFQNEFQARTHLLLAAAAAAVVEDGENIEMELHVSSPPQSCLDCALKNARNIRRHCGWFRRALVLRASTHNPDIPKGRRVFQSRATRKRSMESAGEFRRPLLEAKAFVWHAHFLQRRSTPSINHKLKKQDSLFHVVHLSSVYFFFGYCHTIYASKDRPPCPSPCCRLLALPWPARQQKNATDIPEK